MSGASDDSGALQHALSELTKMIALEQSGSNREPAAFAAISLSKVVKTVARKNSDIVEIPLACNPDLEHAFDHHAGGGPTPPTPDPEKFGFGSIPLFASLSERAFRKLLKKLRLISRQPGEAVFRQGTRGTAMYILSKGTVRVLRENYGKKTELARLDPGEFFGEIALVTEHPRSATVEAIERCELIEIDRRAISELVYEDADVMPVLLWFLRDRLVDTLIRTSPLFAQFPYDRRRALANRFQFIESQKTSPLINQGERAPGLVIVLSGQAEVYRAFGDQKISLARLGPGDICGEMSLLTGEPAVAHVIIEDHFLGLYLAEDDFKAVVSEHPFLIRVVERIAEDRRQKLVKAIDDAAFADGTPLPLI